MSYSSAQLSEWVTVTQELSQPSWRSEREGESAREREREQSADRVSSWEHEWTSPRTERRGLGRKQQQVSREHADYSWIDHTWIHTLPHLPSFSVLPSSSKPGTWGATQKGFPSLPSRSEEIRRRGGQTRRKLRKKQTERWGGKRRKQRRETEKQEKKAPNFPLRDL